MISDIKVSVVTPSYKCSECIEELYYRLVKVFEKIGVSYEIIFVNDASPDNDWEIITNITKKDKRVKGVSLSRNFGQHYAIMAGLNFVSGDKIIVMDCDLQDKPEEIEKLYKKSQEGFDVVFGRRCARKDGFHKKLFSKVYHKVYSYFIEVDTDSSIGNFGIYSFQVIKEFNKLKERNRVFPIFINWLGFKTAYIDVIHSERYSGKTAYTFNKLLNLAIDSTISQSNKPLRLSIKFGLALSLTAFLIGLWFVFKYFYFGIGVLGWTSMMVAILFISGLLFANMGLLGLYIGKIFDEVKNRPLYIINEMINFNQE